MKFYAYIETAEGKEPLGTEARLVCEYERITDAIKRARRWASSNVYKSAKYNGVLRLFHYTNFYDQSTFTKII